MLSNFSISNGETFPISLGEGSHRQCSTCVLLVKKGTSLFQALHIIGTLAAKLTDPEVGATSEILLPATASVSLCFALLGSAAFWDLADFIDIVGLLLVIFRGEIFPSMEVVRAVVAPLLFSVLLFLASSAARCLLRIAWNSSKVMDTISAKQRSPLREATHSFLSLLLGAVTSARFHFLCLNFLRTAILGSLELCRHLRNGVTVLQARAPDVCRMFVWAGTV